MRRNNSSKSKSSNIVLKIGITYIIPIFLAMLGAFMISFYGWKSIYSRMFFNVNKSSDSTIAKAVYHINGKDVNKPSFSENFADISIDSVGIDMHIYECNVEQSLVKGVAHDTYSAIPGEGKKVVLNAYPNKGFSKLKNIKVNDEIIVKMSYGTYKYKVLKCSVVKGEINDNVDYSNESNELMLFTNYPFDLVGEVQQYYMVTCEFVSVE